jgi:hypothetical protein
LKKTHHKKGLVEWLKVQALSLNPRTAEKQTKTSYCWTPVAHAYNSSYSGGRDQEDHGSKPA